LYESVKFEASFWDDYLGRQVFQRATTTITGTNNYNDYLIILWSVIPWTLALIVEFMLIFVLYFSDQYKKYIPIKSILAPLLCSLFIVALFTLTQTHLGTYILPAFPFMAICIALAFYSLSSVSVEFEKLLQVVFLGLVVFGFLVCLSNVPNKVPIYTYEEKAIGQAYKNNNQPGPIYALDWNVVETVKYYGDTVTSSIGPSTDSGRVLRAPFYLFVDLAAESYFYYAVNQPAYPGLKLLFQGPSLALIYSDQDLQLPQFSCCSH
jgi:hypothetical protein